MAKDLSPPDLITSGSVSAPDGTYTLDVLPGFYCDMYTVFQNSLGLNWILLSQEMLKYPSFLPSDGLTLQDMLSNHWIPEAEAEADEIMGKTYKPIQETVWLDGNDTREIVIPYTPIYQIDDVQIFAIPSVPFIQLTKFHPVTSLGNTDVITDYQDSELLFSPQTGKLQLVTHALSSDAFGPLWEYKFIKGTSNVKVTYQHGVLNSTLVPLKLRNAVAKLVTARAFKQLGSLQYQGMTGYRTATTDKTIGREKNMPYGDYIADLTKQATSSLKSLMEIYV